MSGTWSSTAVLTTTASQMPAGSGRVAVETSRPGARSPTPRSSSRRADLLPLALVEGPVAAGGPSAGLGVELGQGAHAAAADAGEVQPGPGPVRCRVQTMTTGSPSSTRSNSSMHIGLVMRTQPCGDGRADARPRGWCRGCRCSARGCRCPGPRLTPSSRPSRVRMRVRIRSSVGSVGGRLAWAPDLARWARGSSKIVPGSASVADLAVDAVQTRRRAAGILAGCPARPRRWKRARRRRSGSHLHQDTGAGRARPPAASAPARSGRRRRSWAGRRRSDASGPVGLAGCWMSS